MYSRGGLHFMTQSQSRLHNILKTTDRFYALYVSYLFLLLNFPFVWHIFSPKRSSKPVIKCKNKPTLSAYSHSMFSQQLHIKNTHILPGSHMSKQTFKSLQKYKILPICISFFYLHFEMAEIIPNWHESPMSHLGAALHFREPFKPTALSSLPMNAACH